MISLSALLSLTVVVAPPIAFPAPVASIAAASAAPSQEADLAELTRRLAAADPDERAMAACEIGRIRGRDLRSAAGAAATRAALIALLGDGTAVEGRLCRRYGNWRDGEEVGSSPGREAAIALEDFGREAVDPLVDVLRGGSQVARENAALALGLIELEVAIAPLSEALADPAAAVRARSAWALGMIEDAAAVASLGGALRDEDAAVREQAAWGLGMIEDASAVELLGTALDDDAAAVREQAAWALGMIESANAVPVLVEALRDDDADVREQAAWALGMIESSAAVDALLEALDDEDPGVRKQALWAVVRCIDADDPDLDYAALAAKLRAALIGGLDGDDT